MMAMEITLIKPSPSSSSKPTISSSFSSQNTLFCKQNSKLQLKPSKLHFFPTSTSTSISLLSFLTTPFDAKAFTLPKEQIVSSLTQVEQTIDQVQQVGSDVLNSTLKIYQSVAGAVKPGIDAAAPVVQQAGEEALKAASPLFSEVSKKVQEAIQSSGISSDTVASATKIITGAAEQTTKVIGDVKPLASSAVETIASSDPVLIVEGAAALFLVYLLLPQVWSVLAFNLRGYKGGLTPTQTFDMLCTQNYYLIDVRTEKDKSKAGIPQLPSSVKSRLIAIPLEGLPNKLRSLVRDSKKVEAEIAALKISYLKQLSKSSSIVIMDSYSDSAKTVAKTLTSLGFKNCWIMTDGFSGRKGWLQSRLGTDSYNLSFAELVSPSRIIPGGTSRSGTTSSTVRIDRKRLPE